MTADTAGSSSKDRAGDLHRRPTEDDVVAPGAEPPAPRKARIAVVEDDLDLRRSICAVLEGRGYEVRELASYTEAAASLRASPPDLLLTDVSLPDGDGLELVARLRATCDRPVPAIVISGMRAERDIVRGYAAGAVDFLAKPFTAEDLVARCAAHLARRAGFTTSELEDDGLPMEHDLAFGRYEVQSLIGRGGNGLVYRATDRTQGDRPVALKVLKPLVGQSDEARLRFLRETYALSAVRHPRVVRVLDSGVVRGRLYYAMELVDGPTLVDIVEARGPLSEREARSVLRGLAEALAALEDAAVLHRDVKPGNVILRGADFETPVLVDFGLAKRGFDRAVTEQGFLVGTTGYIPPEVIRGGAADSRGDLYALGLTLRFALSGDDVFPELRGRDLLVAGAERDVPPLAVPLSPELRALLTALWQRDPDRRPQSAREVLRRLDAWK